jgi:hypothetical protein
MKPFQLTDVLTDDGPGHFRAIAVDADGRAWRQFSQIWSGEGEPLRLGAQADAIIRADDPAQGGAFLELEGGEQVFLRTVSNQPANIGQRLKVECISEARRGKLARVILANSDAERPSASAYQRWKDSLCVQAQLPEHADPRTVDEVFDDALAPQVQIPNGGTLYIEHTRALTAIDIDSAGRISKGSAGARALSLNRDAALETARQLALRDIGGLAVLDCVGPLNKSAASQIQAVFKSGFEAVSPRSITVLAPSRLGLMEISLQHGTAPLHDKMLDETGALRQEAKLLKHLRNAMRELTANPTLFLVLSLSDQLHMAYLSRKQAVDELLVSRFNNRLKLARTGTDQTRMDPQ